MLSADHLTFGHGTFAPTIIGGGDIVGHERIAPLIKGNGHLAGHDTLETIIVGGGGLVGHDPFVVHGWGRQLGGLLGGGADGEVFGAGGVGYRGSFVGTVWVGAAEWRGCLAGFGGDGGVIGGGLGVGVGICALYEELSLVWMVGVGGGVVVEVGLTG